jgi:hypothetical protein
MKKTRAMLRVEGEFGQPLEILLLFYLNTEGLVGTAELLNVAQATIGYWNLKLGIKSVYLGEAEREVLREYWNGRNQG